MLTPDSVRAKQEGSSWPSIAPCASLTRTIGITGSSAIIVHVIRNKLTCQCHVQHTHCTSTLVLVLALVLVPSKDVGVHIGM